jgi:hypothetical protein
MRVGAIQIRLGLGDEISSSVVPDMCARRVTRRSVVPSAGGCSIRLLTDGGWRVWPECLRRTLVPVGFLKGLEGM